MVSNNQTNGIIDDMSETILQFVTTTMIALMSFLGWKTEEYLHFFTPKFQKIITEISQETEKILPTKSPVATTKTSTSTEKIIQKSVITVVENTPIKEPKETVPIKKEVEKKTLPEKKDVTSIIPKITETIKLEIPETQYHEATQSSSYKDSIANIYCTIYKVPYIQTVTGSATAISENVYLTNSHLAFYIMLQNLNLGGNISCSLREGSPAKKTSTWKVIFVSPLWIQNNTNAFSSLGLSGNGEHDYALLLRVSGSSKNSRPLSSTESKKDEVIYLAGFPAFNQSILENALYPLVEKVTIENSFFKEVSGGLLDTSSTPLAKIGSSGGGAFNEKGEVVGIISAAIQKIPGADASARVVSISYIKNEIKKESGISLEEIISSPQNYSGIFLRDLAPTLANMLLKN